MTEARTPNYLKPALPTGMKLASLAANPHYGTPMSASRYPLTPDPPSPALMAKLAEAIAHYQRNHIQPAFAAFLEVLEMNPNQFEALLMLGMIYHKAERLDLARNHLERALALRPDHEQSFQALAHICFDMQDFATARPMFETLRARNPDSHEIKHRLSIMHFRNGELDQALTLITAAIMADPHNSFYWTNFHEMHERNSAFPTDPVFGAWLLAQLESDDISHQTLPAAAVNYLVKLPPTCDLPFMDLTRPEPYPLPVDWFNETWLAACNSPLLFAMLQQHVVRSIAFERLLTGLRYYLLMHRDKLAGLVARHSFLPDLLAALALQAWQTDYAIIEQDNETACLPEFLATLPITITDDASLIGWLLYACYRPILNQPVAPSFAEHCRNHSNPIRRRAAAWLVDEPLQERDIMTRMAELAPVEDSISLAVAAQYHEHPYPRWQRQMPCVRQPLSVALYQILPQCHAEHPMWDDRKELSILVAGCGTGQHANLTARSYLNCHVTAIDISRVSLAYAIRKTEEFGIDNVHYLHGDILDLDRLDQQFDLVECSGVLHHMRDPMQGWQKITARLKPGGFMRVGLYSELARKAVVQSRAIIAAAGYASDDDGIRAFRRYVHELPFEHSLKAVTKWRDFYNLSETRDLLFHVQEHRFTIPQIANACDKLGLRFLGFHLADVNLLSGFRKRFPDIKSLGSLDAWHQYEQDNPDSFISMYQFWCQKR